MVLVNNKLTKSFKKLPLASWQALTVRILFRQFPGAGASILKGLDVRMAGKSFITTIKMKGGGFA